MWGDRRRRPGRCDGAGEAAGSADDLAGIRSGWDLRSGVQSAVGEGGGAGGEGARILPEIWERASEEERRERVGKRVEGIPEGEAARVHDTGGDHGAGCAAADGEREAGPEGAAGAGADLGSRVERAAQSGGGDTLRIVRGSAGGGASGTRR